jgi:hypothetical protein
MKKIIIQKCDEECPYHCLSGDYSRYCDVTGYMIEKEDLKNDFPVWCPLNDAK